MIYFPLILAIVLISVFASKPHWKRIKRNKVKNKPFNRAWRNTLKRKMPYFLTMPTDLQLQLKQHIQVFINEKNFIGCNGVEITDEIKVLIAAQASLLILNRPTDYYPNLTTILVYPRAFIKQQKTLNADGVAFIEQKQLAGESWDIGKVILSWEDTVAGAESATDGRNLVIHEFAHQLDQENGQANGAPILVGQNYTQWSAAFELAYKQLQHCVKNHTESIFDYYGATNPAEFFAVASEVFFEKPQLFKNTHTQLYQQLVLFYSVDPTSW